MERGGAAARGEVNGEGSLIAQPYIRSGGGVSSRRGGRYGGAGASGVLSSSCASRGASEA